MCAPRHLKKAAVIFAVIAIIAAALVLRVYRFAPPPSLADYTANPFIQLPPGLQSDEAYDATAALRTLRGSELFPYSDIDQGRAIAHIYLTALVIAILGPIAESSRIASVIASLLSIAGMAWLVWELFRSKFSAQETRVLLLIAIAQVAGTYWFVHFGRIGLDNIAVPWLMLPAFAMLWRWLHQPKLKSSVLAGLLLGVTLYSYPAAYVVPVVVALTLAVFWSTTRDHRPPFSQLATYIVAFGLIALPLVVYALNNPDQFTHRIQGTAAGSIMSVLDNTRLTLAGVFLHGDDAPFYNLPGRPLLDPVQSVFALLGGWMILRRIKQPEFLFVLLWSGLLLLPSILSVGSPAFNRMTGAVPGILMLVALGGLQLYRWLSQLRWKWIAPGVIAGLLAFTFLQTAHDYFDVWPNSNGLLNSFSLAERIQAESIAALPTEQQTYLSPSDSQRSIFTYLWQDRSLATSFNGRRCTIAPLQTRQNTRWIINSQEDKRTRDRLAELYPQIDAHGLWANTGTLVVQQFSIGAGAMADVPTTTLGFIGDLFELRDYRVIDPPIRGGRLRARFLWKPLKLTPEDWTIATYLIDAAGQIRVQDDRQPCDGSYPTSRWQTDELISDDRTLEIPQDLPPGEYTLGIVFYRLGDNTRLPVRGPGGTPAGDMLTLGKVQVP